MNKTLLSTALLSILCSASHADNTTAPANAITAPQTEPTTLTAPTTAPTPPTPTLMAKPPTPTTTPATTPATTPSTIPAPQPEAVIDCKYRVPADKTSVEQSLVTTWAKQATVQSFDFNPATIDDELGDLKPCYTDQGWKGFNDALQKSGNIDAIKSQHLTVSSQTDGDITINAVKDNQWKVTVPLQVVYQNDKEKLTQLLNVDLIIGRKISGDLGIMQMIATPRQATGTQQPPATVDTMQQQAPADVKTGPAATPAAQGLQPTKTTGTPSSQKAQKPMPGTQTQPTQP